MMLHQPLWKKPLKGFTLEKDTLICFPMEETQEDNHSSTQPTAATQALQEIIIEAEAIFEAALGKLGSNQHKIQFETTYDQKYFAILSVQINGSPYTKNPKKTTIYSYFYDNVKDAREDVYSGAVDRLQ